VAQRAAHRLVHLVGRSEARRVDDAVQPVLADLSEHLVAVGPVAEDHCAELRKLLPCKRNGWDDCRHVLLRDVPACEDDDGLGGVDWRLVRV